MKLKIWTEAYTPFIMGGDVNAPIATNIEVDENSKTNLGCGFYVYEVVSPAGTTHIIESDSGGIVGNCLEQVEEDFLNSPNLNVIENQIAAAKERVKKAVVLSNEDFWSRF